MTPNPDPTAYAKATFEVLLRALNASRVHNFARRCSGCPQCSTIAHNVSAARSEYLRAVEAMVSRQSPNKEIK